jgi:hypothetical protein
VGREFDPRLRQRGANKLPLRRRVDPRNTNSSLLRDLNKRRSEGKFPKKLDDKLKKLLSKEEFSGASEDVLWENIVADTDGLFVVAEAVRGIIESFYKDIGCKAGLEPGDISIGELKDPVRIYEKAMSDYKGRFPLDRDVPCTSNVVDIIRCRVICKTSAAILELIRQICSSGNKIVRTKNKFDRHLLDPIRFRNILTNIGLVDACGELIHIFELQIHHSDIYDANERLHSHTIYEFFRSRLPNSIVDQNIDFVLERRMQLFAEISKVPVLLSLLIVVLKDSQGRMPETIFELYEIAIDNILRNAKLRNRVGVERFLTSIAFDNHNNKEGEVLKPRRLFETGTVKTVLSLDPELGSIWKDLSKKDEIPLVKTIQRDCQEYVVGGGDEWVEETEAAPAQAPAMPTAQAFEPAQSFKEEDHDDLPF